MNGTNQNSLECFAAAGGRQQKSGRALTDGVPLQKRPKAQEVVD